MRNTFRLVVVLTGLLSLAWAQSNIKVTCNVRNAEFYYAPTNILGKSYLDEYGIKNFIEVQKNADQYYGPYIFENVFSIYNFDDDNWSHIFLYFKNPYFTYYDIMPIQKVIDIDSSRNNIESFLFFWSEGFKLKFNKPKIDKVNYRDYSSSQIELTEANNEFRNILLANVNVVYPTSNFERLYKLTVNIVYKKNEIKSIDPRTIRRNYLIGKDQKGNWVFRNEKIHPVLKSGGRSLKKGDTIMLYFDSEATLPISETIDIIFSI